MSEELQDLELIICNIKNLWETVIVEKCMSYVFNVV